MVRQLQERIAALESEKAGLEKLKVELEKQVAHLTHLVFGRRSERCESTHPLLPFPEAKEPEPPPPPHVAEAADE